MRIHTQHFHPSLQIKRGTSLILKLKTQMLKMTRQYHTMFFSLFFARSDVNLATPCAPLGFQAGSKHTARSDDRELIFFSFLPFVKWPAADLLLLVALLQLSSPALYLLLLRSRRQSRPPIAGISILVLAAHATPCTCSCCAHYVPLHRGAPHVVQIDRFLARPPIAGN